MKKIINSSLISLFLTFCLNLTSQTVDISTVDESIRWHDIIYLDP